MPVEKFTRTDARTIYSPYQYTPYPEGHERQGLLQETGSDTYRELAQAIKERFKDTGLLEQGEYDGLCYPFKQPAKLDTPIPLEGLRGLISWAEEGSCEGQIVYVGAIYRTLSDVPGETLMTLWGYKTFGGLAHALEVAGILTRFFSTNG